MADLQDKIESRRRALEKFLGALPGYQGYQQQEKRRDADKQVRDALYAELRDAISRLDALSLKLANEKKLDLLADIDRTTRQLRTVADRIRLADYGYAGFFDAFKIQEPELDAMYAFDLSLSEQVQAVKSKAGELKADEGLPQGLSVLVAAVEALDQTFDTREKKIMGVA